MGEIRGAAGGWARVKSGFIFPILPWFPILFPVFIGALVWGGLYLRDGRLRALMPLRS
jgi:hypothetical protein